MVQAVEDLSWRSCCEEKGKVLRSGLELENIQANGTKPDWADGPKNQPRCFITSRRLLLIQDKHLKHEEQLTRIHIHTSEYSTT
jgi:hypothetical protein